MIVLTFVSKSTLMERGSVSLAGVFSGVMETEMAIISRNPGATIIKITNELTWYSPGEPNYYEGYEVQLDEHKPCYNKMVDLPMGGA